MADGEQKQPFAGIWPHILSMAGAVVVVTLWGASQSSRIDVLERLATLHEDKPGHDVMLTRERRNANEIDRLKWQHEQLQRELNAIRQACPGFWDDLNPTDWPRPMTNDPHIQQTSIP